MKEPEETNIYRETKKIILFDFSLENTCVWEESVWDIYSTEREKAKTSKQQNSS